MSKNCLAQKKKKYSIDDKPKIRVTSKQKVTLQYKKAEVRKVS